MSDKIIVIDRRWWYFCEWWRWRKKCGLCDRSRLSGRVDGCDVKRQKSHTTLPKDQNAPPATPNTFAAMFQSVPPECETHSQCRPHDGGSNSQCLTGRKSIMDDVNMMWVIGTIVRRLTLTRVFFSFVAPKFTQKSDKPLENNATISWINCYFTSLVWLPQWMISPTLCSHSMQQTIHMCATDLIWNLECFL